MYKVGASKVELTFDGKGFGMMGYGRPFNIIKGRSTPLYARSFCFENNVGQLAFFVQAEICMVFPEIKEEVLFRLGKNFPGKIFRDDNIMLTAQHTHSGPAGFSHYPLYNFSVPGFRPHIFEAIVSCFYEAIVRSYKNRQLAILKFTHGDFPEDAEVGFNRSLRAYNMNPDVEKRTEYETHLAMERTMWLLKAETPEGKTIGQINWFGVHPTSLGNRVYLISYDNKGYAAEYLEEQMGEGSVGIFAQQFTGDISPNFHGKGKSWPKGKYKDDIESAKYNGRLQSDQAARLLVSLSEKHQLSDDTFDTETIYRNMANVEVAAEFTNGQKGERTSLPCHGVPFIMGTPIDGKGAPELIGKAAVLLSRYVKKRQLTEATSADEKNKIEAKYKAQHPKDIAFETGEGAIMGFSDMLKLPLPGIADPLIAQIKKEYKKGALRERPWTPVVLPLQYMRIGELAIIGFPGEITTVAGQKLRTLCQEILAPAGVKHVVISSYANSYFGYCTTYEEYQAQCYEGGHTVYGNRTNDAFRTEYKRFISECLKPAAERSFDKSLSPEKFSAKELELRMINTNNKS